MQDRLLEEYVERLKKRYPQARIMLIGSRARGDSLPSSDYDLLVILPRVDDKLGLTVEMRRLKPPGLPLDLVVVGEDELHEDPLIKKMLEGARRLA